MNADRLLKAFEWYFWQLRSEIGECSWVSCIMT